MPHNNTSRPAEIFGYSVRIVGHDNITSKGPYIASLLLTLLSPICFAASVYMILGRVIRATGGEKYSLVSVRWITKIFLTGDLASLALQGAGGAIISRADTKSKESNGRVIVLIGLAVQLIFFAFFVTAALIFHVRMLRNRLKGPESAISWQKIIWLCYLTSALITFRNIFRVVEFAMGTQGYLWQNEWPLYAFDAIPMALTMLVCVKFYDRQIQPQEYTTVDSVRLTEQSLTS